MLPIRVALCLQLQVWQLNIKATIQFRKFVVNPVIQMNNKKAVGSSQGWK